MFHPLFRIPQSCRAILSLLAPAVLAAAPLAADSADTMELTDEPGNWFRSVATGASVTIVNAGDRVDFRINDCCTNTRHTVTLVVRPDGSRAEMDQDSSQKGSLSLELDVPGVYVVVCKVHPYMTGVIAARDPGGNIPDVTASALPFIGHLGVDSLPATTVLAVLRPIAASEEERRAKWQILGPDDERRPAVPGVGEVWVNTQFERVPGQRDSQGVEKPGTITVLDAATFRIEREINGLAAGGLWNNPHNMWANFALDTIYNSNWFGRWINRIERVSGRITSSIKVGEAPTHIITIPGVCSDQQGTLTIPLSAENNLVKVEDRADGLHVVDSEPTGGGRNHPHGHWLTCGAGDRTIVPNVFKGLGLAGSVSIIDSDSGEVLVEFTHEAEDELRSALLMPLAAGECHVHVGGRDVHKAYVANAVSGFVTVIDVDGRRLLRNIPVTLTPDDELGRNLLHTLQVPIQTPVSPDGRFVAVAVLSQTTVARRSTGSADHVAIIDARSDEVVALLGTPAGTHGVNWGAKLGGGYYAYVTNQYANVLTVIDPDPNGDGSGSDAAIVGTILLANDSEGAGVTDGVGGQGIKPLPMMHDGWIQRTVVLATSGRTSAEVRGWIDRLTDEQKDPDGQVQVLGDVNFDGVVNQGDLAALLAAFRECRGSPSYNVYADFDDSGCVDQSDLALLLSAYGNRCP